MGQDSCPLQRVLLNERRAPLKSRLIQAAFTVAAVAAVVFVAGAGRRF